MPSTEVQRTLVKSPPELWAELSDPASLARHLGEFGEIRIAHVEPETAVEWEAESVRGAVELKPSGWGTKVTLTAVRENPVDESPQEEPAPPEPQAVAEPEQTAEPQASTEPEREPEARLGRLARLFRRWRRDRPQAEAEPEPERATEPEPEARAEPAAEPDPTPEPDPVAEDRPDLAAELAQVEAAIVEQDTALLSAVLDRLGAAHHRPFSRG